MEQKKTFFEKINNLIKNGSKKLADATKTAASNLTQNNQINLQLVFEIIIKILIMLVLFACLKVVVFVFKELGLSISDIFFNPLDEIYAVLWNIFLSGLYIVLAIMIAISLFKEYFFKEKKETEKVAKKEIKQEVKESKQNKITAGNIILLIVKILVILYIVIPFIIIDGFAIIAMAFTVVYIIKGINLWGLCILLIGSISLITYLIKLIWAPMFSSKKPRLFNLLLGIFLIIVGAIMTVDMVLNIDYKDKLPISFQVKSEAKQFHSDNPVYLNINSYPKESVVYAINENMPDGEFIIKTEYPDFVNQMEYNQINDYKYSDYCVNPYKNNEEYARCHDDTIYTIINVHPDTDDFVSLKNIYNNFINDLKNNKIYNYNKLFDYNTMYKVEIEANEKTLQTIKIK